ncbi:MAG: glutathione binding-like protein [Polyangiales bacterium]
MKLYFSPLACSLATRIALYEAGADAEYVEVDPKTKKTSEGSDFRAIHPLGLVPTLALDDGAILTENAAILQLVAERHPEAGLAPRDPIGRARLQQWLCFIGTELHKAIYVPLLDEKAHAEVKAYSLAKVASRLSWLARELEGREFLLDRFSVADAYLFTVLNWSMATPVDLKPYPAITSYVARIRERPHVARAFSEELESYRRERARHAEARSSVNSPG